MSQQAPAMVDVPCDYCGSEEREVLLRGADNLHDLPGRFTVVCCRSCGFIFTSPRPSPEDMGHYYPAEYGPHLQKERRRAHWWRRARQACRRSYLANFYGYPLGRRLSAPLRYLFWPVAQCLRPRMKLWKHFSWVGEGRLLDLGCGSGGYVREMADLGWRAQGLDLSEQAVEVARGAGLDAAVGTLPGFDFPAGSFDVVTMWHVLEHVPSPKETLAAVHRILAPSGRLVILSPAFDSWAARRFYDRWFSLDLPRHVTHFTRATLRRHLEQAGFETQVEHGRSRSALLRKSYSNLYKATGGRAT